MKRLVYLPDPTINFYVSDRDSVYISDTDGWFPVGYTFQKLESFKNDLENHLMKIRDKFHDVGSTYKHPYFKGLYDRIELYDIIEC